jgi:hypothetical protein
VWTRNLTLEPGKEYLFRFFNGYDWEDSEIPPDACRLGDKNRPFTTPDRNGTFFFQYNQCNYIECDTCAAWICDSSRLSCDTCTIPCDTCTSIHGVHPVEKNIRLWVDRNQGILHISLQEELDELFIYDINGRLRRVERLTGIRSKGIPVRQWEPGIFFTRFTRKNQVVSSLRFVIFK